MKKEDLYLPVIIVVILAVLIGGLIYLNSTHKVEIAEFKAELDTFCIDKGYEEATSRFLKQFAGGEFVQCMRQIGILDANDKVIEFKTTTDYFFFRGKDK